MPRNLIGPRSRGVELVVINGKAFRDNGLTINIYNNHRDEIDQILIYSKRIHESSFNQQREFGFVALEEVGFDRDKIIILIRNFMKTIQRETLYKDKLEVTETIINYAGDYLINCHPEAWEKIQKYRRFLKEYQNKKNQLEEMSLNCMDPNLSATERYNIKTTIRQIVDYMKELQRHIKKLENEIGNYLLRCLSSDPP